MGLPVPTVSVDSGPDWAQSINASLSIIDGHDHSPGSGVLITPSGIDVNSDFPFNNMNATVFRSVRFNPQSAPIAQATDIGCLYEAGVDLYYNDGGGNQIRITQSGTVTGATGTITGLPSGTASASYSAGVFTFESATSTPAELNVGSVVIGQEVAGGFGVTVQASASQTSNYGITLPAALPAALSYLQMDTSGNILTPSTGIIPLGGGNTQTTGSITLGTQINNYSGTTGNVNSGVTESTNITPTQIVANSMWIFNTNAANNSGTENTFCIISRSNTSLYQIYTVQGGSGTNPTIGIGGSNDVTITNHSGGFREYQWSFLRIF